MDPPQTGTPASGFTWSEVTEQLRGPHPGLIMNIKH